MILHLIFALGHIFLTNRLTVFHYADYTNGAKLLKLGEIGSLGGRERLVKCLM